MKELTLAEKLFKKVSKKERDKIKLEQKKAEIEAQAKDSKLLAEYLDILTQLTEQNKLVKEDLEPLRVAMQAEGRTTMEDKAVKVTTKKDYTRSGWNTQLLYEDFGPETKIYQKYITETSVKGSIKVEDK
jgi:hypothetical protein